MTEKIIETLLAMQCPRCLKFRMYRPEGHITSDKMVKKDLPNGKTIEHLIDICDPCRQTLSRRYYTDDEKVDAKKVLDAMKEAAATGDTGWLEGKDKSLEELL